MKKYVVIRSGMYLMKCRNVAGVIRSHFTDNQKDAKRVTLATAKKYATLVQGSIWEVKQDFQIQKYYW